MMINPDYITARDILLDMAEFVETEQVNLSESGGRILGENLIATENVPPFDRSPYDGYALRAEDVAKASREKPIALRVLEEIPAGKAPSVAVAPGTASKLLTGAPIPAGADAVIKFEETSFDSSTVFLFAPVKRGQNIIRAGEDLKKGSVIAHCGDVIDPGLAGTLAAQGVAKPIVYRRPRAGILSTGNELVEVDGVLRPETGKIYNSNRYMLETVLTRLGYECTYLGTAEDSTDEICNCIETGLKECDVIISTGGVSVGDYDLTAAAMEMVGATLLFRGVDMKPGMACAYGICGGKLLCGLSGNPASALTNLYAVALPALRKIAGLRKPLLQPVKVTLSDGFTKKSPKIRFLRGKLDLCDGISSMRFLPDQGNGVLSSAIGCDVMAMVPAGSGPVCAGTVLEGFLL